MREIQITAADEQRLLGRPSAGDEFAIGLVRTLKCMEITLEAEGTLAAKFAPLGTRGKDAKFKMANAGFNCTGTAHAVLDVVPATRNLIPAEQFVYECKLIQQQSLACPVVLIRLLPPAQPPGTLLEQHNAVADDMMLSAQTTYYGCR